MNYSPKKSFDDENNQRFCNFFEHIAIGLVICDTDGSFININHAFCQLTGYKEGELMVMSFKDIVHYEELKMVLANVKRALDTEIDNCSIENRFVRKDKKIIWGKLTVSLIRDENNVHDLFYCTIQDITLQKQMEENLSQSQKNWFDIFHAIAHPTTLLDENHKIIDVNEAVSKVSGKTREELIGTFCYQLFHNKEQNKPVCGCPMDKLLKTGKIETLEMEMEAFNGTFLVSCTPLLGKQGKLNGILHIATDITRLKQTEQALQESESRYRKFLDTAPVGIAVYGDDEIVFINQTGSKMLGAEFGEEIIGKNIDEFIASGSGGKLKHCIQRLIAGEEGIYPIEDKFIRLDGREIDVQVYGIITSYDEKPAVQVIVIDITDSKRDKENILELERRFTNIMKSVNLVSIILDSKGNIIFCNQYMLDLTGYRYDELIGENWFEIFIPPKQKEEIKQVFIKYVKEGNLTAYYENEILARDGTKLFISWNNTFLRETNGEIIAVASIGQNLSKRKLAEEALNKTQSMLTEMGRIAKIGGWEFDVVTRKGTWTDEVARIHDLPPGEDTNVDLGISFYYGESRSKIDKAIVDAIEHAIPYDLELEMHTIKGNRKWVRTIAQIEKEDDKVRKIFGSIQDITERVLNNQELIKAKVKAEESDKLKTVFLANMSHEVRTPLNAILGFSNLLDDPKLLSQKRKKFVNIVHRSGSRLMQLINDIIDISRIEAKQLSVNNEMHSLLKIVNNSIQAFKESELLQNKPEIDLIVNFPDKYKEIVLRTDENRLQQVLDNLLINAVKYTTKGFIEVGLEMTRDVGSQIINVYVRDTGSGIPKEKYDLIFERFRQLEEFTYHEGTGLGLSISKGIMELLGGEIWFTSELNKGTTFYVSIPYEENRN